MSVVRMPLPSLILIILNFLFLTLVNLFKGLSILVIFAESSLPFNHYSLAFCLCFMNFRLVFDFFLLSTSFRCYFSFGCGDFMCDNKLLILVFFFFMFTLSAMNTCLKTENIVSHRFKYVVSLIFIHF